MTDTEKSTEKAAEMSRVVCTRENASTCINGVRFGVLARPEKAPPVLVSELIAADVAERFCRGKGFAPFDPAACTKKDLADADVQIAAARVAATEAAAGNGGAVASLERQLAEQQTANQRQSGELQKARQERDAATQRLTDSSVPKLEAQVKQLADEVVAQAARIATLEHENADLRRINAELAPPETGKKKAAA